MEALPPNNAAAVQGTNDSSIVSKASMATAGYFKDNFLAYFVKKVKRRAPLINRGYYVRMKAIDYLLRCFISKHSHQFTQIISLGAGFDSSFFRLHEAGCLSRTSFFEIDYPEVADRKAKLIMATKCLKERLVEKPISSPGCLSCSHYKLIGCDLNDLKELDRLLVYHSLDYEVPTFILSECVMTYMDPNKSSDLIKWAGAAFSEAMFASYEQIHPNDAFGNVMMNHFNKLKSPLRCIQAYPTMESQIQRYKDLGWSHVKAMDMNNFYNHHISKEERVRIDKIEPFDEFEEWHLKCSHYTILMAFTDGLSNVGESITCSRKNNCYGQRVEELQKSAYSFTYCESEAIQRYGHVSAKVGKQEIFICGGVGALGARHTRLSNGCFIRCPTQVSVQNDAPTFQVVNTLPEPLAHASLTTVKDNKLYLFGGRNSPVKPSEDIFLLEYRKLKLNATDAADVCACDVLSSSFPGPTGDSTDLKAYSVSCRTISSSFSHALRPCARWRHSITRIKASEDLRDEWLFLFGGRAQHNLALSDTWLFHTATCMWTKVETLLTGRHSHSSTEWNGDVVLFGGLDEDSVVLNTLEVVHMKDELITVRSLTSSPPLPPRYSHSAHILENYLVVIGGIDLTSCLQSDVLVIDLQNKCWKSFTIPMLASHGPFMLHAHSSVLLENNSLVIVGGGGNCFSFGTHLNQHLLHIDLNQVLSNLKTEILLDSEPDG